MLPDSNLHHAMLRTSPTTSTTVASSSAGAAVGFGGNPKLGMGKPKAAAATMIVGSGPTRGRIIMNYRRGLLSFGPIKAL